MKIIVASNDIDKIKQISSFFSDYDVLSLSDAGIDVNFPEKEDTFAKNARAKAICVSKLTDEIVLAFDSGLSIDCLNGFPGIDTYTLLGVNASDKDRNNYILGLLEGKDVSERSALFTTCMAVVKNKEVFLVTADTEAVIAFEPKNRNGRYWGYDPILVVKDGLTLAEVRRSEHNKIISFTRALSKLKKLHIL